MIARGTEHSGAIFSDDYTYRYRLWRHVGTPDVAGCIRDRRVAFLMLNPSTANEAVNDPTIRRCISFARAWGAEWLDVINLFAMRSTDPKKLRGDLPPVGPDNDAMIDEVAGRAAMVICAWGKHGNLFGRGDDVRRRLNERGVQLMALSHNADGTPAHPLYQLASNEPRPWTWGA